VVNNVKINIKKMELDDYLCVLVGRVAGYISRGPGSIPGDARFSE
jgi:hypothetical protein